MPAIAEDRPRFGRIVVATDFSSGAMDALSRASRLPLRPRAALDVVHVVPLARSASAERHARDVAQSNLDAFVSVAQRLVVDRPDVRVSSKLLAGSPAREIARHAQERDADLVVIGRTGEHRVRNAFLGSTARSVVRTGDRPVLVVETPPRGSYRRPLLAVAREALSHRLVRLAAAVVDPDVHVAQVLYVCPSEADDRAPAAKVDRADAERWLAGFVELEEDAPLRLEPRVRLGTTAHAILDEARRLESDLLVLGAHERGRFERLTTGGVGEYLLERAACDVLVAARARSVPVASDAR